MGRLGRFQVMIAMMENPSGLMELEQVLGKMKFVPVRVECRYENQAFDYIGHSHLFDELQEGIMIPEYAIETSKDKDGWVVSVHANKI